jgi:hypothetical protein
VTDAPTTCDTHSFSYSTEYGFETKSERRVTRTRRFVNAEFTSLFREISVTSRRCLT